MPNHIHGIIILDNALVSAVPVVMVAVAVE